VTTSRDRWWWTKYNYRLGKLMAFLDLSWCPLCDGHGRVLHGSQADDCPRCYGRGILVHKLERRAMYEQLREEFEIRREE